MIFELQAEFSFKKNKQNKLLEQYAYLSAINVKKTQREIKPK